MEELKKDPLSGLAYFISLIFHPLLMPTIFFSILLLFSPTVLAVSNQDAKYMLLGMVCIFTFVFPLLSSFLLFYSNDNKRDSFLSMENSKDRVKPFLLSGFIYLLFAYMLHEQLRLNSLIVVVILSVAVAIILSGIISYFWKISIHTVGTGGILGFFIVLNEGSTEGELFYIIVAGILISGCVMSARLYLNQHNPAQVLAGYLLGLSIGVSGLLIFK